MLLANVDSTETDWLRDRLYVYQQQAFRAGLSVTEELDRAIARCKPKVQSIVEECRRKNRKFRDIEFDLRKDTEKCLHGLTIPEGGRFEPEDILRVSQIFEDPQFIIDGVQAGDIDHGRYWFLSAVATLASRPDLIEKICVARDEQVGIYGFIFCRDGEWADVIIDDQLCTRIPKYETLSYEGQNLYHGDRDMYNKTARKGSKTLYFGHSSHENETWVPLLEKAFAKFHGDYASLMGGFAFEALEVLTGGISHVVYTNDILDKDRFWREELLRANQDKLFGCFLDPFLGKGVDIDYTPPKGLISLHVYSILEAVEYKGKRFLKVRNSWGDSEWTGRWSEGSKEWIKDWRAALEILHHDFGDDGVFIMEYEDFLETWSSVECTQLFDSSWIQSSHWLNVTSRTFPCAWQFGDVSFTFTMPKKSPTIIVLSQADARFWNDLEGCPWSFDFVLFKRGSEHVLGRSESSVRFPRSITLTDELEAGDYILHVRLDRNYYSPKDYVATSMPGWDKRKLSRVQAERARSASLAANFISTPWLNQMVVPPETFAGRDLIQIEMERFEAATQERKRMKSKLLPGALAPSILSAVGGASSVQAPVPAGQSLSSGVRAEIHPEQAAYDARENVTTGAKPQTIEVAAEVITVAQTTDEVAKGMTGRVPNVDAKTVSRTQPNDTDTQRRPDPSQRPVHTNISCNGCGVEEIVGVRWNCRVCDKYDLCEQCRSSGAHTKQHLVGHRMLRIESPDDPVALHDVICDGCNSDPILGKRWTCLTCYDYDLCDACHASGAHPSAHHMLKIEVPADAENISDVNDEGDDDDVLLGLRIYTKNEAQVNINGQLRHGKFISRRKK